MAGLPARRTVNPKRPEDAPTREKTYHKPQGAGCAIRSTGGMPLPHRHMGTTSILIEQIPSRLAEIAKRIDHRRRELGLTQDELAAQYNQARLRLCPAEDRRCVPRMTRDRLAKILSTRLANPGRSAARALYPYELRLLAAALDAPFEWLQGPDPERPIVLWDPMTEPRRAEHLLHLIVQHERLAPDRLSWAEFLPCSFVPSEFMHAHHAAIFGVGGGLCDGSPEALEVVRLFDTVGLANRERTLVPNRAWPFTHHMFLSDLRRLAAGEDEYAEIPLEMRRACLLHLCRLLADASMRMRLVVADDDALRPVRQKLRSYDSLFITGQSLAMWRDRAGTLFWSEHPEIVAGKRQLLETFRTRSLFAHDEDTLAFVGDLAAGMGSRARRRPVRPALQEETKVMSHES